MTKEEAIADFKEEVENGKVIVRAYRNNGLTVKNLERTIERDEMAISALSVPEREKESYVNKKDIDGLSWHYFNDYEPYVSVHDLEGLKIVQI